MWPESKPNGFDPSNLIQIMLAQENIYTNNIDSLRFSGFIFISVNRASVGYAGFLIL